MKHHTDTKEHFKELCILYFFDDKLSQGDFQTHMFFDMLNRFLVSFDKNIQAADLRKVQKKKKEDEKKKTRRTSR